MDRQELAAITDAARTALPGPLGLGSGSAIPAVPVVAHPSDAAYERATGRPWFTLGAYVGGQIHLMPLDQLRQRGMLERTLRREIVHTVVDEPLRARPQWVRDGIALYYSGTQSPEPGRAGPCPGDAELLRPTSAGALTRAYAAARDCAARQLSGGRRWTEVR
jgi:hypothetical protein